MEGLEQGAESYYVLDAGFHCRRNDCARVSLIQILLYIFSLSFSLAYSTVLDLNHKSLLDNYNLWGANTRTCIKLLDPREVEPYAALVTFAAELFTRDSNQFENSDPTLVSHQLFVVRPGTSRRCAKVEFASNHVLGFVSRAYASHDYASRSKFYKMISAHNWFGASAGYIFETGVLLWLRHPPSPPARDYIPCHRASPTRGSPDLNIPACRENIRHFSKVEELGKVDEKDERPMCLVPFSTTFPTLDAIILTDNAVITVQMTISSKHSAKQVGFKKVYDSLPIRFLLGRQRCHVFLTDTEEKAKSLQNQKVQDIPGKMKINFYSAFLNFGNVNSVITTERVQELENAGKTQMDVSERVQELENAGETQMDVSERVQELDNASETQMDVSE